MFTKYLPYQNPELDGRCKVTPETAQSIKELYHDKKNPLSMRAIARLFDIDKGTVKAYLDPNWYKEKQQKRYKLQPWKEYYTAEKHRLAMKKVRAKKKELNYTDAMPETEKQCPFCQIIFITKKHNKIFCTNLHAQKYYNKFKRKTANHIQDGHKSSHRKS
uniref:Uncharacterized protein n=1 Tax=viral metagenome TaxID=1070528 RepID=A0A6H2A6B5_9ZZZZ